MEITFLKMAALGNDFVILDARSNPKLSQIKASQIAKIANRKNVGCDQLIILKNCDMADVLMEIYNQDGSVSGACGNATRCVAGLLLENLSQLQAKSSNKNQENPILKIKTAAGVLLAWQVNSNIKNQANSPVALTEKNNNLIAVNMGKPSFNWQQFPFSKPVFNVFNQSSTANFVINEICPYQFSAINVGNPHIVAFLEQNLIDEEFFRIAPKLENHSLFLEKTNVEFAQILSPNHIQVRVWERGVGETEACGSGACAVAVLAIKQNLAGKISQDLAKSQAIKISFKGGSLDVSWLEDGSIIMVGGYEKIFTGAIDANFL